MKNYEFSFSKLIFTWYSKIWGHAHVTEEKCFRTQFLVSCQNIATSFNKYSLHLCKEQLRIDHLYRYNTFAEPYCHKFAILKDRIFRVFIIKWILSKITQVYLIHGFCFINEDYCQTCRSSLLYYISGLRSLFSFTICTTLINKGWLHNELRTKFHCFKMLSEWRQQPRLVPQQNKKLSLLEPEFQA